jgi:hypothetical protein
MDRERAVEPEKEKDSGWIGSVVSLLRRQRNTTVQWNKTLGKAARGNYRRGEVGTAAVVGGQSYSSQNWVKLKLTQLLSVSTCLEMSAGAAHLWRLCARAVRVSFSRILAAYLEMTMCESCVHIISCFFGRSVCL